MKIRTIIRALPRRRKFLLGKDSLAVGYPWLTYGAIMALEQIIKPDFRVLELGCGGSTIFFARRCEGGILSFETNKEWAEKTEAALVNSDDTYSDDAIVVHGTLNEIAGRIQELDNNSYDIVLVDHKDYSRVNTDRLPLALEVALKVKIGGWLVVDNYAAFGMDKFDYSAPTWDVYTFDDVNWKGRGTRLCKRLV